MSMFLPEQGQATPTGVTEFTPSSPQTTQEDVALMQRVLQAAAANPLMIPPDLMAYILDYIQTSRLIIPIGQVFGFTQQQSIRGRVASDGSITNGTGFTVSKLVTGAYGVTFTNPLPATPSITATVDDNSAAYLAFKVANATADFFQINIYDMSSTLVDAGFYFTASPFV